eukprot:CAMPEP_0195525684 /NCGR_PEP_ID=MMETSP0794_2-20130614/26249_1 /TAXON_ID=515487 /ORGANISM="Stephanopyxis turris, Strain CCMP 815" /LENGTH=135 /DNA_ID=CAMNT_0040656187 /DNA_START=202 /DNA_END=606 /DNA_ORIENTATION=-
MKGEISSLVNGEGGFTTTLVVFPSLELEHKQHEHVDFLSQVRASYSVLEHLDASGISDDIQLVNFHPNARHSAYEVGELKPYDFVTRSPYPTMHLLRTKDLLIASKMYGSDTERIPLANLKKLDRLGLDECKRLW